MGSKVLLIHCWALFSCVGASNETNHDFVAQLQKKEVRSQAQKQIKLQYQEEQIQKANGEWETLTPCLTTPSDACRDSIRKFIAQYEYAVVESMGSNNQEIISTPVDIPQTQEAKRWLQEHDSSWLAEKKLSQRYSMKRITANVFVMGCQIGDDWCNEDEFPPHVVTFSNDYYIGTTEVTQELYTSVMGSNPSRFRNCGPTCPVETVDYFDAVSFVNALSDRESLPRCYIGEAPEVKFVGLNCKGYRLPTEAEWEFAARSTGLFKYAGSDDADEVGWIKSNSGNRTHPVGQKKPNQLGLYDMSGNVWEWTWANYAAYATSSTIPLTLDVTTPKVIRGGAWSVDGAETRVAIRHSALPVTRAANIGFRLVRTMNKKEGLQ